MRFGGGGVREGGRAAGGGELHHIWTSDHWRQLFGGTVNLPIHAFCSKLDEHLKGEACMKQCTGSPPSDNLLCKNLGRVAQQKLVSRGGFPVRIYAPR